MSHVAAGFLQSQFPLRQQRRTLDAMLLKVNTNGHMQLQESSDDLSYWEYCGTGGYLIKLGRAPVMSL